MTSSHKDQNLDNAANVFGDLPTPTSTAASPPLPPPKYTMNPQDRVKRASNILFTAQSFELKDVRRFEGGVKIIDLCTHDLDTLTLDPYIRRTWLSAQKQPSR